MAMACGIPTVLSPIAAEGIDLHDGETCLIAETPAEWVEAIERLQTDPELWQRMRDNARDLIADRYGRERAMDSMRTILEAAKVYI